MMETDRIARALIARTLPKSEWTHHAHLRAGLWHLLHYPEPVALALLRERIRAYNEATGVANTESGGYHETITRFYLHVIRVFLESVDRERPIDELAQELVARGAEHDLVLRYYSRERLFSREARRSWVEPELLPLPGTSRP
jgi:hypothetical protein